MLLKWLMVVFFILSLKFEKSLQKSHSKKCNLPDECTIYDAFLDGVDVGENAENFAIDCRANDLDRLNFSRSLTHQDFAKCKLSETNLKLFSFRPKTRRPFKMFRKTNLFEYMSRFGELAAIFNIFFVRQHGFLIEPCESFTMEENLSNNVFQINRMILYDSLVRFFSSPNREINTCKDMEEMNLTSLHGIRGIFQSNIKNIILDNCRYKANICPLVFSNSQINHLTITQLRDTFFAKNLLAFQAKNIQYKLVFLLF